MKSLESYLALVVVVVLSACTAAAPEYVDISNVLHDGAVSEITNAYPEFQVKLVAESKSDIQVGERFLEVEGIEDAEIADRLGRFVASYLNDPERREREVRERTENAALPPREKMNNLVDRIRVNNPDFTYEWVGAEEGNTRVIYGDNGLRMDGIDNDGAREEWGHAIWRIQEQIDAETTGEQE